MACAAREHDVAYCNYQDDRLENYEVKNQVMKKILCHGKINFPWRETDAFSTTDAGVFPGAGRYDVSNPKAGSHQSRLSAIAGQETKPGEPAG